MAGRPSYCRCYNKANRWVFNDKGYIRCQFCGGAAPRSEVNANAVAEANRKGAMAPTPAPKPKPQEKKQENLVKVAAVLNAKKEKDEKKEEEAALSKTRKVGKAKVLSTTSAKTGGVVKNQEGQGYIFADEPETIYVVGDGWFGAWPLAEVEYSEPTKKSVNLADFYSDVTKADILINNISDWNAIGVNFVPFARNAKQFQERENLNPAIDFVFNNVEYVGFDKTGEYHIGKWNVPGGDLVNTFAVARDMWRIL